MPDVFLGSRLSCLRNSQLLVGIFGLCREKLQTHWSNLSSALVNRCLSMLLPSLRLVITYCTVCHAMGRLRLILFAWWLAFPGLPSARRIADVARQAKAADPELRPFCVGMITCRPCKRCLHKACHPVCVQSCAFSLVSTWLCLWSCACASTTFCGPVCPFLTSSIAA